MNEIIDTLGMINLDAWNATDSNIVSYLKTPLQQTFFANNAHLIGKTLRQAIIYFSDTLNSIDRTFCSIGNEFRSTRTRKYSIVQSETTTVMEITTLAPIAFEDLRSMVGITRQDFHSSFHHGGLIDFANTGKSGSQMYKTSDEVNRTILLSQKSIFFSFNRFIFSKHYEIMKRNFSFKFSPVSTFTTHTPRHSSLDISVFTL